MIFGKHLMRQEPSTSVEHWSSLPPAEQTAAIDRELRLLDVKGGSKCQGVRTSNGSSSRVVAEPARQGAPSTPYVTMTKRSTFWLLIDPGQVTCRDGL